MAENESGRINQNWFHLRYTDGAPEGLPPVVQAERMVSYSDSAGTWLAALWQPRASQQNAACILRVRADHVSSVTRHADLGAALNCHIFD